MDAWECGAIVCGVVCVVFIVHARDVLAGTTPAIGKHVLITGCDTGFGNLATKAFDKAGYTVHACCLTDDGCEALLRECSDNVRTHRVDVTSEEDVRRLVAELTEANVELWAVVNNAGLFRGSHTEFTLVESFKIVIDVNYLGAVRVTKALIPFIQRGGRIVNLASSTCFFAFPCTAPYAASKFAMRAFTDALRVEMLPWGIKVCMVAPGAHFTNLLESGPRFADEDSKRVSSEVRQRYGRNFGSELTQYMEVMKKLLKPLGFGKPQNVVKAIECAVCSRWPKRRYIVGLDSYAFLVMSMVPSFIMDPLIYLVAHSTLKPQPNIRVQSSR